MQIRELRIRYIIRSAMGAEIVHAIVTTFPSLQVWADKIRAVGYPIVGIDERIRDEKCWMELDEGWTEIVKY